MSGGTRSLHPIYTYNFFSIFLSLQLLQNRTLCMLINDVGGDKNVMMEKKILLSFLFNFHIAILDHGWLDGWSE